MSQGCRPIGKPLRITKVDGNVVLELGGKPALDQLAQLSSKCDHDHERHTA